VHLYFHVTDLLERRRSIALQTSLTLLARRRTPADLDRLVTNVRAEDLPIVKL
jgi:hypothetical protein